VKKGTIHEPAREIAVEHDADVIVAGGGMAGFGAAWGAAKAGARVLLLEANNAPGGVYTFQGIQGMTKLFYGPDGKTLVMRGVLKEMVERYKRAEGTSWDWEAYAGYSAEGWTWWCYDPELLKLVLTDMLQDIGVRLLFNTWVTRGICEDGVVRGVIYESKEGRKAASARCVVDSTGDALVAHTCGVPMQELPNPWFSSTFLFRVGNVDIQELFEYLMTHPGEIGPKNAEDGERRKNQMRGEWEDFGFFCLPDHAGLTLKNCVRRAINEGGFKPEYLSVTSLDRLGIEGTKATGIVTVNTGFIQPATLTPEELTDAQIQGRKAAYYVLRSFLRPYVPGFGRAAIVSTANELGIRTSRRIAAELSLTKQDIRRPFPDVVAVFNPFQTSLAEVPYRTLVPLNVDNILVASGRSFPSEGRTAHPYREGCCTLLIGQAAGAAAALSARLAETPRQIPWIEIQRELLQQDMYLGPPARLQELRLSDQEEAPVSRNAEPRVPTDADKPLG